MIKKVTVYQKQDRSDAFTMVLTSPTNVTNKTGFVIDKIDGLGPVEADINTTEMVVDGDLFNSARIGKRNIVMDLIFYSETGTGIEEVRQYSYRLFPIKKMIYIEVETDNRTLWTQGYIEKNEPNIFSDESATQVSIICPDPKWYELLNQETTLDINDEIEIDYDGEVEVGGYLTLTIDNDITAPVHDGVPAFTVSFANEDGTAQSIDIYTPNEGFIQGDVLTICTITGQKSCVWTDTADADHNALNLLNQNPDWFSLKSGINTVRVTDSNSALASAEFINPVCYEGV
ncbi:MAG: phage tail family protein [Clostridiales bacterium]|nr:phage tail family protein [Clostridiales bacterium]